MLRWIKVIWDVILKVVAALREQRAEAQAELDRIEAEDKRRIEEAQNEIDEARDSVEETELDPSEDSEDPMGINNWNSGS